jgi:hypothetical protein
VKNASCVKTYVQRPQTAYEHAREIRHGYGYWLFEDAECATRFARVPANSL